MFKVVDFDLIRRIRFEKNYIGISEYWRMMD
jgi:hypothetical protein